MTVTWRKSTSSGANTSCVEVANSLDAVRDSKNPSGPVLSVDRAEFTAFLADVKSGRFDG
ncbi:DUF397 domain-containing protein [Umezawaea endophytica]|uniref:DUF397 domain-containing protein n=1 Tax=Umezawaea endophytica TaxID=1654476 RepID=A0A9X2VJZ4_9PSEU|nr:DUF397 domain-containing protein [Umezawaea endophytica]